MHARRLLVPALALIALLACRHGKVSAFGDYEWGKTAQEDYEEGVFQMNTNQLEYAEKFFDHCRTKYPYSKYAALSDLRIGDVRYKRGTFSEAADAYQNFLKLHPTHEEADYAAFRTGIAYWNDTPSDFFLVPPREEKDLTREHEAAAALQTFLDKYPKSKYRQEGEQALAQVRAVLLRHEWYAVDFYEHRHRWPGVAARLEGMVRDYPQSPRDAEALYKLAQAYVEMKERYRAQQTLQQLLVKHPDAPERGPAEKLLASLR